MRTKLCANNTKRDLNMDIEVIKPFNYFFPKGKLHICKTTLDA